MLYSFLIKVLSWNVAQIQVPKGFSGGSVVKNLPASAGDAGSIPGSGRFPGGGNGKVLKLFQYSCWDNPMDRGPGKARVPEVAKSRIRLSTYI